MEYLYFSCICFKVNITHKQSSENCNILIQQNYKKKLQFNLVLNRYNCIKVSTFYVSYL